MNVNYGDKCKVDSDCPTNVCETVYDQNKNPKGRFCLDTSSKAGRVCESNSDCESGECKKFYDDNSHFVEKRCTPAGEIKKDDTMFFKDTKTPYGLVNDQYRDKLFSGEGAGGSMGGGMSPGPIAKFISYLAEAIVTFIKMIVTLLYSIWKLIFSLVSAALLSKVKGDMIFGIMTRKNKNGYCASFWFLRALITILLPPFGVFLARGINGIKYIIICSIFTAAFYFPGLIYAFIVMGNSRTAENERRFIAMKKGKMPANYKEEESPVNTFMKSN